MEDRIFVLAMLQLICDKLKITKLDIAKLSIEIKELSDGEKE